MGIKLDIKKEIEGLSDNEILKVFREIGFDVSKGTGEINIHGDSQFVKESKEIPLQNFPQEVKVNG